MGEYQYYEFLAIDRPLTEAEQKAVSCLSSRVEPHPWRAAFVYHWSDLPVDPEKLLAQYYDAMLYMANWGSRRLMFRFPRALLDADRVRPYTVGSDEFGTSLSLSQVGEYVFLNIEFREVNQGEWLEGEGWLDRLVGLREDLLRQDDRLLYLAWLKGVADREVDEEQPEPPVPPGLRSLSPALRGFVELFDVDTDLLAIAAERSGAPQAISEEELRREIAALSPQEKDEFLLRLARGEPLLSVVLNRRLAALPGTTAPADEGRRTAGQLLAARKALRERRRQERAAKAQAKRLAALEALAQREDATWSEVETLVATYQAKAYDEATRLLGQLRELAAHRGQEAAFAERLARLAEKYQRRPSFMDRLRAAGLLPGTPSGRPGLPVDRRFAVLDEEEPEDDEDTEDDDEAW